MKKAIIAGLAASVISISANAEESNHNHHGHHDHGVEAPIGVMGSHTHDEGDFMLSYRFSRMSMKGNRDGTKDLTPAAARATGGAFAVAPLDMDMEMHMFGAMYGLTNDVTLMAMAPYTRKVMGHVTGGGAHFTTETHGLGDVKLSGLVKYNDNVHFNIGFSVPTGSNTESDQTPVGHVKLPYPMQLGSGTFDPILGVTYQDNGHGLGWGAQANAVLRLYDNRADYHLGNEYNVTSWVAKPLNDWLTGSLRLDARAWENISGEDTQIALNVPTAREDMRGGERVDLVAGFDIAPESFAAPIRAEFGMPLYQNLEGPQLKTNYRMMVGTQYSF